MAFLWGASAGTRSTAAAMEFMTSVAGSPAVETNLIRNGDAAYRINNTGAAENMVHSFRTTQGVFFFRGYLRIEGAPSSVPTDIFMFSAAGNAKLSIRVQTNRKLIIRNIEDTANVGSESPVLSLNTFYRVELKVDTTTLASTTVEGRLYADDVNASQDWSGGSGTINLAANIDRFHLNQTNADAGSDLIISDIVIYDNSGSYCNDWPGHGYLAYLFPNEAGASASWARGGTDSGANWSQLDEKPPNDITDYVQSATSGEKDYYGLVTPAAIGSSDEIKFIAPAARFRISSTTGGDPDFAVGIKSGANEDISGNVSGAGSTTWRSLQTAVPSNYPVLANNSNYEQPGGSNPWTKAALDAAEFLLQETVTDATPHYVQVSAVWVLVGYSEPATGDPPTVVIDTSDDTEFNTDQPEILFTGTDPEANDITYNIQITDNSTGFVAGDIVTDSLETGSTINIHPNPVLNTYTWEGNRQVDDRIGILFYGRGGFLDSIDFEFSAHETTPQDTDGSYLVHIYNAAGYVYNGLAPIWEANHAYSQGTIIRPNSLANGRIHFFYRCKVAGTSGSSEPSWPGNDVDWKTVTELGETPDGTGTLVWETLAGAHPNDPADYGDTPTGGWIAVSDVYAYNPGVVDLSYKTCEFTGSNRIRLVSGQKYFAVLDWRPNNFTNTNSIVCKGVYQSTEAVERNCYLDGASSNNYGPRIIDDARFRVRETFILLDKVSDTDDGFANKDNGGDTDPFTSGDQIGYTVQTGEALADGVYQVRVRGIDPADSNIYGNWSSVISIIILIADVLTANNITTPAAILDAPTIGQTHQLSANGITTEAPILDAPTLTSGQVTHDLVSEDILTEPPVLDTPIIGQTHQLTADGITAEPPILDAPTIHQTHGLTSNGITSEPPILDAPTIHQTHGLTSNGITSEPPILDTPSIGQTHILSSSGITTGNPILGTPSLSSEVIHELEALGIITEPPVLETPNIGQIHSLTANNITTEPPVLSSPTLQHIHALLSNGITTEPVIFGTPNIGQTHILLSNGITTEPVIFGTPFISEVLPDELEATDITTESPILGTPVFSQIHTLTSVGITSSPVELESPILGQIHILSVEDLLAIPILDSPLLGQTHILVSEDILFSEPILGSPVLTIRSSPTDESRIYKILYENRLVEIEKEDRSFVIPLELREIPMEEE